MRVLVDGGVRSLTATPPTLEELFLRHYGEHVEPSADDAGSRQTASAHEVAVRDDRHPPGRPGAGGHPVHPATS